MATTKRQSTYNRLAPAIKEAVYAAMNRLGDEATTEIKEATPVYQGRLQDSHTYALLRPTASRYMPSSQLFAGNPNMGRVGSNAEPIDVIHPVSVPYYLKIGTAVSYAPYVDKGTGRHLSAKDSEGFIRRITEWGQSKGFTEDQIYGLIQSIRYGGTRPHPFMIAGEAVLEFKTSRYLSQSMRMVLKLIPPVRYHIDSKGLRTGR